MLNHSATCLCQQDIAAVHFRAEEDENLGVGRFRQCPNEPSAFDFVGADVIDRSTFADCIGRARLVQRGIRMRPPSHQAGQAGRLVYGICHSRQSGGKGFHSRHSRAPL